MHQARKKKKAKSAEFIWNKMEPVYPSFFFKKNKLN